MTVAWITASFSPEVSGIALGNVERVRWFTAQQDVRLCLLVPGSTDGSPLARAGTPGGLFTGWCGLCSLIVRTALLGSLMSVTTAEMNQGRAVELERYERDGHRST
ncbi:hypothetical protein [Streptomyces blastmyceticus]|uniref:Uncharacterized protein n=1 Tax=Streptomyces blastmyceticus TaxID=68180 RepID=A0ABN0WVA7_9ACTN